MVFVDNEVVFFSDSDVAVPRKDKQQAQLTLQGQIKYVLLKWVFILKFLLIISTFDSYGLPSFGHIFFWSFFSFSNS